MELRHLRTFQVVAKELNLSKAAELLRYTQPTITLQLQALEKEIGYPLLQRIRKKTFLTPAGIIVKEHADQLFSTLRQMEAALQTMQGPTGRLRIAAPEYYCANYLTPVIRDYFRLYPSVQLEITSCHSKEAIQQVLDCRTELAIIAGESNQNEMREHILDEEDVLLVAAKSLLNDSSQLSRLNDFPFFMHHDQCNFVDIMRGSLAEIGLSPKRTIASGSEETIKQAVLGASGWALLSSKLFTSAEEQEKLFIQKITNRRVKTKAIYLHKRENEANIASFAQLLFENWPK